MNTKMVTQQPTRVIFRTYGHTVIALFPEEPTDTYGYMVSSYAHVGKHSAADYYGVMQDTRAATPTEYASLKAELEAFGYILDIVKRASSKMHNRRNELVWENR